MPISVFGSLDTSSFVRKLYLKLSFSEIKIAEHIEMEKQNKIKKSPDPSDSLNVVTKFHKDEELKGPSMISAC